MASRLEPEVGRVQRLTPSCEALYVPDIDASLDDEQQKREFWSAFRKLGDWYAELPPYLGTPASKAFRTLSGSRKVVL